MALTSDRWIPYGKAKYVHCTTDVSRLQKNLPAIYKIKCHWITGSPPKSSKFTVSACRSYLLIFLVLVNQNNLVSPKYVSILPSSITVWIGTLFLMYKTIPKKSDWRSLNVLKTLAGCQSVKKFQKSYHLMWLNSKQKLNAQH